MSSPDTGHSHSVAITARHYGAGLLLFDLDDTIVQAGSFVSERVLAALRAAHEAGYVLSIASGRPLSIVNKPILEACVMDFALCSNGASVVRLLDGESLVSRLMSCQDALDCYDMLRDFRPGWNAFCGGKAYFEWRGASYMLTGRTGAIARTSRYADTRVGLPRRLLRLAYRGARYVVRMLSGGKSRQVVSVRRHVAACGMGVEKMGCTIPDATACARAAELLRSDGRYEVASMGATELEITALGVTKGTGAAALMEAIGIDSARSVAFGDGGNDLPLAEAVGRFVAMGNADEKVKEAAFEVCPPVNEDGVAVWIENMLAAGGLREGVTYV